MKLLLVVVLLGLAALNNAGESESAAEREARILAAYSTRTLLTLTTSTTTVPYTCHSAFGTSACTKRRYRRLAQQISDLTDLPDEADSLSGSLDDEVGDLNRESRDVVGVDREGRIALTVWSTTSSIFTLTTSEINSSTTFSVSFFCSIAGASFPPSCG